MLSHEKIYCWDVTRSHKWILLNRHKEPELKELVRLPPFICKQHPDLNVNIKEKTVFRGVGAAAKDTQDGGTTSRTYRLRAILENWTPYRLPPSLPPCYRSVVLDGILQIFTRAGKKNETRQETHHSFAAAPVRTDWIQQWDV